MRSRDYDFRGAQSYLRSGNGFFTTSVINGDPAALTGHPLAASSFRRAKTLVRDEAAQRGHCRRKQQHSHNERRAALPHAEYLTPKDPVLIDGRGQELSGDDVKAKLTTNAA